MCIYLNIASFIEKSDSLLRLAQNPDKKTKAPKTTQRSQLWVISNLWISLKLSIKTSLTGESMGYVMNHWARWTLLLVHFTMPFLIIPCNQWLAGGESWHLSEKKTRNIYIYITESPFARISRTGIVAILEVIGFYSLPGSKRSAPRNGNRQEKPTCLYPF